MTKAIPNISQYFFLVNVIDPTKTITLRQRFVRDMNSRFFRLMADVREAVVDLDVFGLKKEAVKVNASGLSTGAFDFPTNSRKIDAFTEWMDSKAREYILAQGTSGMRLSGQIVTGMTDIEAARKVWINTYLDSAYQQGIRRARQELRKKGVEIDEGQMGGDPIKVAFNGPIHADRVGMIYTRAYTSLKGITAEMESAVSDVLAMGLAEGRGPKQIARILDKTITGRGEDLGIVDKLGRRIDSKRRAEVLARTETIRAHHAANMGEYRAAGAMGISVLAEHLTAGDGRVCPKCAPLNGKKYTLEEAEYIIPVHPQCRCVAIPYIEDKLDISPTSGISKQSQIIENWLPQKTMVEIEDKLNRFHIYSVNIESEKLGIEYGNRVGGYLTEAFNGRPGLKKFVEGLRGRVSELSIDVKDLKYVEPGTLGTYSESTNTITIGSKYKVPGKLKIGSGVFTVDSSPAGTFMHEYGHFLRDHALDDKIKWNRIYVALGRNDFFKKNISRYAGTNAEEAFAESFSAWASPSYNSLKKKLPKEIEDYFEEVFK
jgi:SPP1 gp7 family putative phage head morphogenesis protein